MAFDERVNVLHCLKAAEFEGRAGALHAGLIRYRSGSPGVFSTFRHFKRPPQQQPPPPAAADATATPRSVIARTPRATKSTTDNDSGRCARSSSHNVPRGHATTAAAAAVATKRTAPENESPRVDYGWAASSMPRPTASARAVAARVAVRRAMLAENATPLMAAAAAAAVPRRPSPQRTARDVVAGAGMAATLTARYARVATPRAVAADGGFRPMSRVPRAGLRAVDYDRGRVSTAFLTR